MLDDWHLHSIRIDIVSAVLGAVVLSFLVGSAVTYFERFPYDPYLRDSFVALEARSEQSENVEEASETKRPVGYTNRKRYRGRGVVERVESKVAPGYTLFSVGIGGTGAKLVAPGGEIVHRWRCTFDDAYPDPAHIDDPVPSKYVAWRKMHMYPNGDVVVVYTARFNTDTPNGYGIVKLDRHSNILWAHEARAHHDVDVGPEGKIYTLTQKFRDVEDDPVLETSQLSSEDHANQVLEDSILVLSPEGNPLRRFSILDAMKRGGFARKLEGRSVWDVLHTNNVDVLGEDFAEHHASFDPGDVVVSFRTLNAVAVLDVDNEKMRWMYSGSWRNQHDPDPMPNGDMYIYDNQGVTDSDSRIMRVEPSAGRVSWTYGAGDDVRFQSKVNGEQDPLPNGNVLVTESKSGRLFEVTRDHQIVWDYRSRKVVEHEGTTYTPSLLGAKRYAESYLDFDPENTSAGDGCDRRGSTESANAD